MRRERPADPHARERAVLTDAYYAAVLAYSQKKFGYGVPVRGVEYHPPFSSLAHSSAPDRSVIQFGRNLRDPEQDPLACAKARIKEHRSDWSGFSLFAYASFNSFFLDEVKDRDAVTFKALLTDLGVTFYEGNDSQGVVTLYRGDNRHVDTILRDGFRPKLGFGYAEVRYKDEFLDYYNKSYGVSTSKDKEYARRFPDRDRCRLSEIRFPPGAVKHFVAVALYAMHHDAEKKQEVNFLQPIPPWLIHSVTFNRRVTLNDGYLAVPFVYQPKVKVPALEIEVEPQVVVPAAASALAPVRLKPKPAAPALHPLHVMLTTGARVVVAKGKSAMAMAHLIFLTSAAAQAFIDEHGLISDNPNKPQESKRIDASGKLYSGLFVVRMSPQTYPMLQDAENNLPDYAALKPVSNPKNLRSLMRP